MISFMRQKMIRQSNKSIDIIARKLWMRSDPKSIEELHRLKTTLAAYSWYKQISQPSSRRYDTFFATILQKKQAELPMLPTPVRILTWNHDLLIERSFYEFCLDCNHVEVILFEKHGVVHQNG